ncbi:hypothetical protein FF041_02000 [Streptomyces jumonjinensis]|uniref:Transposase IS4 N-terminal domain-containing protein n=1 Tax=Streptomyces jumonjinensis TaxID=1945 RepID=A0A646K9Z2_STRJU|nr:hypothetical protein [Streptomyces jumonjinensis]
MVARLVDRIGLGDLTEVFPPELVDAALAKRWTGAVRVRLLPPRLMVYFVLARALFSGEPYREVLRSRTQARGQCDRPQAGRAPDARGRTARNQPTPTRQGFHPPRPGSHSRPGPGPARLHRE